MVFLLPTRRFSFEGEGTEINYVGGIYIIFTDQLSIFCVHCIRVEGGVERCCTILGTRLSETVCVAVGPIGVKGGRGVFIV